MQTHTPLFLPHYVRKHLFTLSSSAILSRINQDCTYVYVLYIAHTKVWYTYVGTSEIESATLRFFVSSPLTCEWSSCQITEKDLTDGVLFIRKHFALRVLCLWYWRGHEKGLHKGNGSIQFIRVYLECILRIYGNLLHFSYAFFVVVVNHQTVDRFW